MTREIILRPDAAANIEDVADYTINAWGSQQAKDYIRELRRAVQMLAVTALRYPPHHDIYPGLRRKRSGMHHIYYLAFDDRVEVLNIIHVQSDPALHLRAEGWRGDTQ